MSYRAANVGPTNAVQEVVLGTDESILYQYDPATSSLRMIYIDMHPRKPKIKGMTQVRVRGYSNKSRRPSELPERDDHTEALLDKTFGNPAGEDEIGYFWLVPARDLKALFVPTKLRSFVANLLTTGKAESDHFVVVGKTLAEADAAEPDNKDRAEAYIIDAETGNYTYPEAGIVQEFSVEDTAGRTIKQVLFPDPFSMFTALSSVKLYQKYMDNEVYKPINVQVYAKKAVKQKALEKAEDETHLAAPSGRADLTENEAAIIATLLGKPTRGSSSRFLTGGGEKKKFAPYNADDDMYDAMSGLLAGPPKKKSAKGKRDDDGSVLRYIME